MANTIIPSRRELSLILAASAIAPAAACAQKTPPVVTMLGDSITAGFGLPAVHALPAQLEAALMALGAPAVVRNAGVSGDTSAGGVGRVDLQVKDDTAVCVVALGANDQMRGYPASFTRNNLDTIIKRLQVRKIGVVLAGLTIPGTVRAAYAKDFNAIFAELATARGVPVYPDLMAGVSRAAGLRQSDGIHPNAAGAKLIAERLAPVVAQALAARG